jgi:sugar transferase (PEP-CTERM system associated)
MTMRLFNRFVSIRSLIVFGGEVLLIFGSVMMAARLQGSLEDPRTVVWRVVVVAALCQVCLYFNDFYDLTIVQTGHEVLVRLLQATGAASIALAVVYFALPDLIIGQGIFVSSLALFIASVLAWRLLFIRLTRTRPLDEHVLIMGTGATARTVARQILAQRDFGYRIVGFVDEDPSLLGVSIVNPKVVGTSADLPQLIATHGIDRIIVGLTDRRGHLPMEALLHAKLSGVRVEDATTAFERLTGKILVDDLRPSWLIFSDGFRLSRLTRLTKRSIDLGLSFIGFVVAAPLMVLTAAAIWLESGLPVLYSQERVGQFGRSFILHKFRSMRADAEPNGEPLWAQQGDRRVTHVGRVIRTTRLDELPQLWNVLRGDMSFVGPRPERPYFVQQLTAQIPFYQQRHAVKPGVTGWAQVKYRYGASFEDAQEKLRYDLYYI